ncbi:hypothetical protein ACU5CE_31825 [Priestia megaterium]|uniref:hypothetical protein n=1 Tax=Priestia megaterium TaxID=1404 RepID=UPI00406BC126
MFYIYTYCIPSLARKAGAFMDASTVLAVCAIFTVMISLMTLMIGVATLMKKK